MKKIEAIIRTSKFFDVKDALKEVGVNFFTFSDVKGVGNQNKKAIYRGSVYDMGAIARTKIEIVISKNSEAIIDAILKSAYTGEMGDGKVFVYDVEQVVQIRTGLTNEEAL